MLLASLKALWRAWKRLGRRLVALQNGLVLLLVFFLGVGPAALLARLTRRPLLDRRPPRPGEPGSEWRELPETTYDLEWARRSF